VHLDIHQYIGNCT